MNNNWEQEFLKVRRSIRKRMRRVQVFNIPLNQPILDIGCGDGLDLLAFKQSGYTNLTGLDRSAELLSLIKDFPTIHGDAVQTGLRDSSIDCVFVNSALHHIMEYQKCLKEIHRILKSDGMFCFIEPRNLRFRRIIDFISLSPLGPFIPGLRFRRIYLKAEMAEMYHWLKGEPCLVQNLINAGFKIVWIKKTLLSIYITCKK